MSGSEQTQILSGVELPRFPGVELDGLVGEGGMGRVYWGTQQPLGRPVAVKALAERFAGDESKRTLFLNEARLLAALDHPNIVRCFTVGITDSGEPYLIMELVAGPTLGRLIEERGAMPERLVFEIATILAGGLKAAHDKGILHLDFKAENVLLHPLDQPDPRSPFPFIPKIADFGVGHLMSDESVVDGTAGSPLFMAPEQHTSVGQCDVRADYYALGCCLCQMLAGRRVFTPDTPLRILEQKRAFRVEALGVPGLSPAATTALKRLMSFSASQRPANHAELSQLLASVTGSVAPPKPVRRVAPAALILATLLIATMLGAVVFAMVPRSKPEAAAPVVFSEPRGRVPRSALPPLTGRLQLFAADPVTRIKTWESLAGNWGAQEDGSGVVAVHGREHMADIRHPLPSGAWRLSARIATLGEGTAAGKDASVAVLRADGSGAAIRLQNLGGTRLATAEELQADDSARAIASRPAGGDTTRVELVYDGAKLSIRVDSVQLAELPAQGLAEISLRTRFGPASFEGLILEPVEAGR